MTTPKKKLRRTRTVEFFSDLREISHAAVAFVGSLAASAGAIALALTAFGVHISEQEVLVKLGAFGALVGLLSKLIDSANDAITKGRS